MHYLILKWAVDSQLAGQTMFLRLSITSRKKWLHRTVLLIITQTLLPKLMRLLVKADVARYRSLLQINDNGWLVGRLVYVPFRIFHSYRLTVECLCVYNSFLSRKRYLSYDTCSVCLTLNINGITRLINSSFKTIFQLLYFYWFSMTSPSVNQIAVWQTATDLSTATFRCFMLYTLVWSVWKKNAMYCMNGIFLESTFEMFCTESVLHTSWKKKQNVCTSVIFANHLRWIYSWLSFGWPGLTDVQGHRTAVLL
jgi:hypothetical protein